MSVSGFWPFSFSVWEREMGNAETALIIALLFLILVKMVEDKFLAAMWGFCFAVWIVITIGRLLAGEPA